MSDFSWLDSLPTNDVLEIRAILQALRRSHAMLEAPLWLPQCASDAPSYMPVGTERYWIQRRSEFVALLAKRGILEVDPRYAGQVYNKGTGRGIAVLASDDVVTSALDAVQARLGLKPALPRKAVPEKRSPERPRVFVVHGRDEGAKEAVARYLDRLGLSAIILHEQPSQGRTLIEKFELHSDASFAVVLLTPDDRGGLYPLTDGGAPRARQNVVLELGYFIAKLGRDRVCALHKGNVELPSDIAGVVYVPLDEANAWRTLLARELHGAGLPIVMDGLL